MGRSTALFRFMASCKIGLAPIERASQYKPMKAVGDTSSILNFADMVVTTVTRAVCG
jgi:hypothetical protein